MARPNQYGALGSLTPDQYSALSTGFSMKNPTGLSLGGIGVNKGGLASTTASLLGAPLGVPNAVNLAMQYNAEKAAQSSLGQNKGFMNTAVDMMGNSTLGTARGLADVNKDGTVSTREAQNYGMGKGLSAYNVNLNPMQGYTPNTVKATDITNVDPTGLGVTNEAVGSTGDLGGATDVGYKGSTGGFLGFGKTEGVGDSGPTGLGDTKQTGDETSIKDTTKGKDLSNTFADDAGASSGDDGTYICTALYEMGDMKKYIYKYDQVYGKRVDPYVYRGYCTWGKYVATKMRDKGIVYKIIKPLALAWAKQMAFDLSKGRYGKNNKVVKVVSRIGESICYALGVVANIKLKKGVKYG
jgi:hypothetical protein